MLISLIAEMFQHTVAGEGEAARDRWIAVLEKRRS